MPQVAFEEVDISTGGIPMRKAFEGISHIVLRKHRYRVVLATRLGSDDLPLNGDCSNPQESNRLIRYALGLRGEERLDILIHEMLHACFWDVKEEGVAEASTDIAKTMYRIGYRNGSDLAMLPDKDWIDTIILRKKRYSLQRVSGMKPGCIAKSSLPHERNKTIQIRTSVKGEREIEALLKGMLIACFPDMDENEAIAETAKSIAKSLWRMGYRRTLS